MDRNSTYVTRLPRAQVSLSARRAWIEISNIDDKFGGLMVALRKESVDRNKWIKNKYPGCRCRSPQGERG